MKKGSMLFLLLGIMFITFVYGFDYYLVDGPDQFEPAVPQAYPGHYGAYVDQAYGTTIRRFTDAPIPPADAGVRPYYPARMNSIENSDGSMIIIGSREYAGFDIYTTGDGAYRCSISKGSSYDHFAWSDTNPNVVYWFDGNTIGSGGRFYKATIDTDTWTVNEDLLAEWDASDFPDSAAHDAYFGTGGDTFKKGLIHDEGPVSWDGRHWLIAVDYMNDEGENTFSLVAWVDRDANGFEQPGIIGMGWVPCRLGYNAGISPDGNYMFWRSYYSNCPSMCDASTCVRIIERNSFTGTKEDPLDLGLASTKLGQVMGYHYCLAYDDLGNEAYVTTASGELSYWRFNNPGNENRVKIADINDWKSGSGSSGFGDSHYGTVSVYPGAREWVAILPTDSDAGDECGYEDIGTSTITFVRLSATDKKIWRVAHARNDAISYTSQLFSGGSRDGKSFYYNSNFCDQSSYGMQLFRVELPDNWWEEAIMYSVQSCSDQGGYYCSDKNTEICSKWIGANDTAACCESECTPDSIDPTVIITHSPQNPSETLEVTLSATAGDNVRLKEVRIYLDSNLINTCTTTSCIYTSGPYPYGTHAYHAESEDYAGNTARDPASGEKTFTITEDTFPPVISNVIAAPSSTKATIGWETDESATSRIDYGLTTGYGEFVEDTNLVTDHSFTITGLEMEKTYYYKITSKDWKSNSAKTTGQFTTPFESQIKSFEVVEGSGKITVTSKKPSENKWRIVFDDNGYNIGILEWYDYESSSQNNADTYSGLTRLGGGTPRAIKLIENTGTRVGVLLNTNSTTYGFNSTSVYYIYPSGDIFVKRSDLTYLARSSTRSALQLGLSSSDWTFLTDNGGNDYNDGDYWMSAYYVGHGSIINMIYSADPELQYTSAYDGGDYLSFRKYSSSEVGDIAEMIHSIRLRPSGFDTETENDEYTDEYRNPATITFATGSGGAYYAEEGCYEITASGNEFDFTFDVGQYTRRNPAFKVNAWSHAVPDTISVDGVTKARGIDYNADKIDSTTLILQYFDDLYVDTGFSTQGSFHPADTNPPDGCIEIDELISFINRWKINSQDVTISDVVEAIGLWKRGCYL